MRAVALTILDEEDRDVVSDCVSIISIVTSKLVADQKPEERTWRRQDDKVRLDFRPRKT
jgi:hypothetical protein